MTVQRFPSSWHNRSVIAIKPSRFLPYQRSVMAIKGETRGETGETRVKQGETMVKRAVKQVKQARKGETRGETRCETSQIR